jgi:hypothetical protein
MTYVIFEWVSAEWREVERTDDFAYMCDVAIRAMHRVGRSKVTNEHGKRIAEYRSGAEGQS